MPSAVKIRNTRRRACAITCQKHDQRYSKDASTFGREHLRLNDFTSPMKSTSSVDDQHHFIMMIIA